MALEANLGRHNLIELLMKAGANIEGELGDDNTPLVAACSCRRKDTVKVLVRAGARIVGMKNGKHYSALDAAKHFPRIVRWILVERHTEQKKLTVNPSGGDNQEIRGWSGPRMAEVVIQGVYQLTGGASLVEHAEELSELRQALKGKVVVVDHFRT